MRQQIQNDLAKAGSPTSEIMPNLYGASEGFARNPVMMIINPDSLTEVTTMAAAKNSAAQ